MRSRNYYVAILGVGLCLVLLLAACGQGNTRATTANGSSTTFADPRRATATVTNESVEINTTNRVSTPTAIPGSTTTQASSSVVSQSQAQTHPVSQPTQPPAPQPTKAQPSPNQPPQLVNGQLKIIFSCSGTGNNDGVVVTGSHAKACAYTLPGAALSIKVSFCKNEPDPSPVLQGGVVAGPSGYYEWNWTPDPHCNGQISGWSASINAQMNGSVAAASESTAY